MKSAGVVVGRVRSIVFDPETFQARVVMDMDARYPFPDDSSAKILTAGLLGEQYVGIEAGADEANLVEGSKIRRTQSAVVLENLISQFLYSKAEDGREVIMQKLLTSLAGAAAAAVLLAGCAQVPPNAGRTRRIHMNASIAISTRSMIQSTVRFFGRWQKLMLNGRRSG